MSETKAHGDEATQVASKGDADVDSLHKRADHEDILHTRRLGLFLTFIAFMAVALGLTDERFIKIVFAVMGVVVSGFWLLWGPNAGTFIRRLRDEGCSRADEYLWAKRYANKPSIKEMDERWGGKFAPLYILNWWLPGLLVLAWGLILIYYIIFN